MKRWPPSRRYAYRRNCLGCGIAIDGRQLGSDDIHIGRIAAIDIGRQVEPSVEHLQIESQIVGRRLLPRQSVGHRRGCRRILERLAAADHGARLIEPHEQHIGIGIRNQTVARRTDRQP